MNSVHKDGRALLKLSRQIERAPGKDLSKTKPELRKAEKQKHVPGSGIQRQDTDYDVKPSIPKPEPVGIKSYRPKKRAKSGHQFHAAMPDTGDDAHGTNE